MFAGARNNIRSGSVLVVKSRAILSLKENKMVKRHVATHRW